RIVAVRDRLKLGGNRLDAVAVAHPDSLLALVDSLEQRIAPVDNQRGRAVLASARAGAAGAQMLRDHVKPVADAEHGASDVQHLGRNIRRAGLVEARRTTRQNDPARAHRADLLGREIVWMNLAIGARLAHAASDELRVLAAEIQNQDHEIDLRLTIPARRPRRITSRPGFSTTRAQVESPAPPAASLRARLLIAAVGGLLGRRKARRARLGPSASGAAELEDQRRADQPERRAEAGLKKPQVVRRDAACDVGKKGEPRR